MKILTKEILIKKGNPFPGLPSVLKDIDDAIATVDWPVGTGKFSLNPSPKGTV